MYLAVDSLSSHPPTLSKCAALVGIQSRGELQQMGREGLDLKAMERGEALLL